MTFVGLVEVVGKGIDAAGVGVIVLGGLAATAVAGTRLVGRDTDTYRRYRQQLGRSILLGLELLVAADIIRTVAVTPTLTSVAVLAGIVLIRTFLSFSLELEITGRWPWQNRPDRSSGDPASPGGVGDPGGSPPVSPG
ncbi:MAG TPA: DUF1622 domain-containing protein [Mycobacteriales bacterium]